jgi:hypothetical protein
MTFCRAICPQADAPPPDATDPGNAKPATGELLRYVMLRALCVSSWGVLNSENTPEGDLNVPNGVADGNSVPPILESFIPRNCLPDVIDVNDDYIRFYDIPVFMRLEAPDLWERFTARHAIKFVRQYPPLSHTHEGTPNNRDGSVQSPTDADY